MQSINILPVIPLFIGRHEDPPGGMKKSPPEGRGFPKERREYFLYHKYFMDYLLKNRKVLFMNL